MPTNAPINSPVTHTPPIGRKQEAMFDEVTGEDGVVRHELVPPSTLANRRVEGEPVKNPDFFIDDNPGSDYLGKGANPSADVVTKHTTTIDPVRGEPSPTADGETVPETVPADLPADAPIADENGEVSTPAELKAEDSPPPARKSKQ